MKLELYKSDTCPYCKRVMNVINELGIDVEMHDIYENQEDLGRLIEVGGKRQVPCLFIDGQPLYESDDIIQWLTVNQENLSN